MIYAPIALFVYNRPDHTRQTVEALQKNTLASQSELIVFSDAAKSAEQDEAVKDVREYIRQIDGFKSVTIIEQKENFGLAKSIIEGVTSIVNKYGRIIVLEDDLVTSPYFLDYMNTALDRYSHESKVWHISGWNYPVDSKGLEDAFFWRMMNCWGWATWVDRWSHFRKSPNYLIETWNDEQIQKFNLDGTCNSWQQVKKNFNMSADTWAVFWYTSIFENNGLCLNPAITYVQNIGLDGSGINSGKRDFFKSDLSNKKIEVWPLNLSEDINALDKIKYFYTTIRPSFLRRALSRIKTSFITI